MTRRNTTLKYTKKLSGFYRPFLTSRRQFAYHRRYAFRGELAGILGRVLGGDAGVFRHFLPDVPRQGG